MTLLNTGSVCVCFVPLRGRPYISRPNVLIAIQPTVRELTKQTRNLTAPVQDASPPHADQPPHLPLSGDPRSLPASPKSPATQNAGDLEGRLWDAFEHAGYHTHGGPASLGVRPFLGFRAAPVRAQFGALETSRSCIDTFPLVLGMPVTENPSLRVTFRVK